MNSRKSVGPRMESWWTPALTGYSCEDFPSWTTQRRLLLRKEKIRPNIWPRIPLDLSLRRRPACKTLSRALDNPRPAKSFSNSIKHNCQKIYSRSRRAKLILEIRKKATFCQVIDNATTYKFFKGFTKHRKKTSRAAAFSSRTTKETFQQSGKLDSLRHILKSSASMYEISNSQFFRTTTEIQSGPDALDESRFVMTFLTILGVMEILWNAISD